MPQTGFSQTDIAASTHAESAHPLRERTFHTSPPIIALAPEPDRSSALVPHEAPRIRPAGERGAKGLPGFQRPAGSLVHAAAIVLWGAEVKSCVPVGSAVFMSVQMPYSWSSDALTLVILRSADPNRPATGHVPAARPIPRAAVRLRNSGGVTGGRVDCAFAGPTRATALIRVITANRHTHFVLLPLRSKCDQQWLQLFSSAPSDATPVKSGQLR